MKVPDPKFIDKQTVASLLPMNECIKVMESTFRSLAAGECLQPLRSIMWLPDKKGLLGIMPGYSQRAAVMGIKVISVFHGNAEMGLPSHQGVVILFDANNGQPLLVLDAAEITAIRTAAASAVATKWLSREDSQVLAIVGAGEQAKRHVEAMLHVRSINRIKFWNRTEAKAQALASEVSQSFGIAAHATMKAKDAVKDADIICTVTASRQPVVMGEWLGPGVHVNAVGASTATSRELDTEVIKKCKLFTDCYESLFNEGGEFLIPKKEGAVDEALVKAELGEVISGTRSGRETPDEITVFKSHGIAAEDIFAAWHIFQKINGAK